MTTAALLEKELGSSSFGKLEAMLSSVCKDLKVKVRVQGRTLGGWVQVEVTGEDESVALKLLDREVGLAPIRAERVARFSALRGKIVDSDRSTTALSVDVGVFAPAVYYAVVPLERLQAQLADGKNLPLQRLVKLFCLYEFMPLNVKITSDLNVKKEFWEAELSEMQLSVFSDWLSSNLDRLFVLNASRREVEEVVERARHSRDIVRIESLGLLEYALVCKLGTDAVGLVPKLGPYLRSASLAPFAPRRIKEELKL